MKNTNKAFTLVELIVVITILAILATIAFISFQGATNDAKDVKVTSDVANLAKKVTLINAQDNDLNFSDLVSGAQTANNNVLNLSIASGATAGINYKVGTVDFGKLQEDADWFTDKDGNDYIFATAWTGSYSYFQVAGQLKDANGVKTALIKGNYTPLVSWTDSISLIANKWAASAAIKSGDGSDLY